MSARDLEALLAFVLDLYTFQDVEALARHTIEAIPRLVSSEVTAFNVIDPVFHRVESWVHPPEAVNFPNWHEIFADLVHQHPLVEHYRRTRDGRALKITDLIPQRDFRRLGLYADFYRPAGVDRQMAFTVPSSPSLVVGVALNRRGRDFSDRDSLVLDFVRPHLVQAYANAIAAARVIEQLRAVSGLLDAAGQGIVVVGPQGRVESITERARALFAADDGSGESSVDSVPPAVWQWLRRSRATLEEGGVPSSLTVERGDRRLHVRAMRLAGSERELLMLEEQEGQPGGPTGAAPLTPRERQVLRMVSRGLSDREIGREMDVSVRTVKKHLEHTYRKLGVGSRTAAVARAGLLSETATSSWE